MGPLEKVLREKLAGMLAPSVLEVVNESPLHGLPKEAEKHFKIIVVSESFAGRTRLERHRLVNEILADELKGEVHALTLQVFTPGEWRDRDGVIRASPECLGGGKRERGG